MKLILDISNDIFNDISEGYTCQEYADELINLVQNGTPIPDNATNGDVIKAMFPNTSIHYHKANELVDDYVSVNIMGCDTQQDYSAEWWNALY